MGHDPDANERQSIANALQLIREANYKEEATFLDDLLQDNHIDVNELPGGAVGRARRIIVVVQWSEEITLDPRVIPGKRVLGRCDAGIVELAGTLLHEGTHLHSTLAIQESTRCRPGESGQTPSGNWAKSGGEVDMTK